MCYAAAFPARSAAGLASEFVSAIPADTNLYSVGQYRHSLSFYLRRPLVVYDYVGELEFGMQQARVSAAARNREQFLEHWQSETSAIAFIDPAVYEALAGRRDAGTNHRARCTQHRGSTIMKARGFWLAAERASSSMPSRSSA